MVVPDNDPGGITSTITVLEDRTILDVNVTISLTHPRTGDLTLSLIGPDATEIILSTQNGGDDAHYLQTIFDDEAPDAITDPGVIPPFSGAYSPEQSLTAFDGLYKL